MSTSALFFLSYSFLPGRNPVTCLAEGSREAGGTQAGEVGDLVDALGPVQARLGLTLVHVCRVCKGERLYYVPIDCFA